MNLEFSSEMRLMTEDKRERDFKTLLAKNNRYKNETVEQAKD